MAKIKEQFSDPETQWEKDLTGIQAIAAQEKLPVATDIPGTEAAAKPAIPSQVKDSVQ
jgi:hypothetical protein